MRINKKLIPLTLNVLWLFSHVSLEGISHQKDVSKTEIVSVRIKSLFLKNFISYLSYEHKDHLCSFSCFHPTIPDNSF